MTRDERSQRQTTSQLLSSLLSQRPRYRRAWQQRVKRIRSNELSHAGIAQVIAEYLWNSRERPRSEVDLARRLRDRVRRALDGEQLTAETLTWFIRAFAMEQADDHRLWSTFAGGSADHPEGIVHTLSPRPPMRRPLQYRFLTIFERFFVNEDRCITDRHVLHVMAALQDGVDCYVYAHEPVMDQVKVLAGGYVGECRVYDDGRVLYDLMLDRSLRADSTAPLEYHTSYVEGYRPSEIRRAFRGHCENVDLTIQFDAAVRPQAVSFAAWPDHYEGEPVFEEWVSLGQDALTHRFVPFVEESVLGFRWEW